MVGLGVWSVIFIPLSKKIQKKTTQYCINMPSYLFISNLQQFAKYQNYHCCVLKVNFYRWLTQNSHWMVYSGSFFSTLHTHITQDSVCEMSCEVKLDWYLCQNGYVLLPVHGILNFVKHSDVILPLNVDKVQ